jgi:hypothetical protein
MLHTNLLTRPNLLRSLYGKSKYREELQHFPLLAHQIEGLVPVLRVVEHDHTGAHPYLIAWLHDPRMPLNGSSCHGPACAAD